jgi:mutator family transposase
VTEMYARRLSTRDVEDAFRDATGDMLLSKSAVSQITDRLWEDYQAFISRDLSDISVEYLFVDAIFESLRRHGAKEALLVGWCIASDGRKHLLHLAVGNKESQSCWTEFFRSMLSRGMQAPTTITSDGAPGADQCHHGVFPGEHPDPVGGFTGWPTFAPSCPMRPPARSWRTSNRCATRRRWMRPGRRRIGWSIPTGGSIPRPSLASLTT